MIPDRPREWWVLVLGTVVTILLIGSAIHVVGIALRNQPFVDIYYLSNFDAQNKTVIFTLNKIDYNGVDGNSTDIGMGFASGKYYFLMNVTDQERLRLGTPYQCDYTVSLLPGLNNTISNCRELSKETFNITRENNWIMPAEDKAPAKDVETQKIPKEDSDRAKKRGGIFGDPVIEI